MVDEGAAQSTTTLLQMPPIHVRAREGAVAVHEQGADPELHVGTQAQPPAGAAVLDAC